MRNPTHKPCARIDAKGQPLNTPIVDARCSHAFCNVPATRIDGRVRDGLVIRFSCGNHETDKPRE